jgi:hypothetical protein
VKCWNEYLWFAVETQIKWLVYIISNRKRKVFRVTDNSLFSFFLLYTLDLCSFLSKFITAMCILEKQPNIFYGIFKKSVQNNLMYQLYELYFIKDRIRQDRGNNSSQLWIIWKTDLLSSLLPKWRYLFLSIVCSFVDHSFFDLGKVESVFWVC